MPIVCAIILFLPLACSKPLVRQAEQSRAEAKAEARIAAYSGSAASLETFKADSVFIVRYDTVAKEKTVAKYYGIEKTKTDTVTISETVIETKTDTVYAAERIFEKSEKSTLANIAAILKLLAAFAIGTAAFFFLRRKK